LCGDKLFGDVKENRKEFFKMVNNTIEREGHLK